MWDDACVHSSQPHTDGYIGMTADCSVIRSSMSELETCQRNLPRVGPEYNDLMPEATPLKNWVGPASRFPSHVTP
jgi:hypothetical protein